MYCMTKYRNKEWLKKQYIEEVRSITDIADECDVAPTTISDWLDRFDIETRDPAETIKKTGILAGENNPMYGKKGRITGEKNPMKDEEAVKKLAESIRGRTVPKISEAIKGSNNPNWKGGLREVTCKNCGKTFKVKPNREKEAKFCSNKCQGEAMKGKNHWNWKGGFRDNRDSEWRQEIRPKVLERDNHKCQKCGMTNKEHKSEFGQELQVHHIDSNRENNSLDNLITLCEYCHSKISNGEATLKNLENSGGVT